MYRLFVFAVLFSWPVVGAAQDLSTRTSIPLTRLSAPIQWDGFSNEPAWEQIPPLPTTVYEPVFRSAPTEHTEVRLAYDDTYLYAAARLYDTTPEGIRSNSLYRDRYSGDDLFALVLDTFNDNESALLFYTNPSGVLFDATIYNDAERDANSNDSRNDSWNTFWDVMTAQTDEGWFVEMRIPFNSLRFQATGDDVTMGVIAYRYIARKNERHVYPAIPPNWDTGYQKPSQAQKVQVSNIAARPPLYVSPYVRSGLDQTTDLNLAETAYGSTDALDYEVGLDVKYGVTDNLTLDLTANTDFAQVEADDQQVNLTRFNLFFPEKRTFFQERSSIFEFTTSNNNRLFHSRRIGLTEDGDPVRILGGIRLVGRVGTWDVGLLNMQTARFQGLPSDNFGVVRLRRQVFNVNSFAGGLFTSRIDENGRYNIAYGLDASVRVQGDDYVHLKWSHSIDEGSGQDASPVALDASDVYARWERRKSRGWQPEFAFHRSGPRYDPGVGFVSRSDFTMLDAITRNHFFFAETSPIRRHILWLQATSFLRNSNHSLESFNIDSFYNLEFKSGTWIWAGLLFKHEDLNEPFELSDDVAVPAGSYTYLDAWLGYSMTESLLMRTDLNLRGGMFYDGWWLGPSITPSWNVSKFLEVGGEYQLNFIRFPSRDDTFTAHIARLRAQAALNARFSVAFFVQFNSAANEAGTNVRLRYRFREGNDLWLVYNDNINTLRTPTEPHLPRLPLSNQRTLVFKYTRTFPF